MIFKDRAAFAIATCVRSCQQPHEVAQRKISLKIPAPFPLKVHKIEIFFGLDFEICIISLLVMSKY
jgi:hypothetical protein